MDAYDCDRVQAALNLSKVLLEDGYPLDIIKGLRSIADAMIDTKGFEPIFEECVRKAKAHSRGARFGYNLPARVAE